MKRFALVLSSMIALVSCSDSSPTDGKLALDSSRPLQCYKDTDCKGDRICDSGQCKSPSSGNTSTASPPTPMQDAWEPPKFSDYPVNKIYSGPPAKLVMDNDTARDYRTQFNENLDRDPSFAGEYIGVQWGCGTECVSQNLINKRTGRVLEDGFGGECGETVEDMRVDSRLIVTKGPVCDDDYNEIDYKVKFYVLESERLKLIKEKSIQKPIGQ